MSAPTRRQSGIRRGLNSTGGNGELNLRSPAWLVFKSTRPMKRILKEPLVHFLLLGAGLFLVYSLMPKSGASSEPGKITVTQGQIENLVDGFTKAWQRQPTPEELTGLVRDRVREEVYCREAM